MDAESGCQGRLSGGLKQRIAEGCCRLHAFAVAVSVVIVVVVVVVVETAGRPQGQHLGRHRFGKEVTLQFIATQAHQVVAPQLVAGDVDGNAHAQARFAPLHCLAAGFFDDPQAGGCHQPTAFGDRDEDRRADQANQADQAALGIHPAQQCFGRGVKLWAFTTHGAASDC